MAAVECQADTMGWVRGGEAMDAERRGEADEELRHEVLGSMRDWRRAHPQASFAALEHEVEARLARLRASMLEEAALASPHADLGALEPAARPCCPDCGHPLVERGRHTRRLTVRGNHPVHLTRSYAVCPSCGRGLFPPG